VLEALLAQAVAMQIISTHRFSWRAQRHRTTSEHRLRALRCNR
jgi:hypothetical protein